MHGEDVECLCIVHEQDKEQGKKVRSDEMSLWDVVTRLLNAGYRVEGASPCM
jgi:hypothetical protein